MKRVIFWILGVLIVLFVVVHIVFFFATLSHPVGRVDESSLAPIYSRVFVLHLIHEVGVVTKNRRFDEFMARFAKATPSDLRPLLNDIRGLQERERRHILLNCDRHVRMEFTDFITEITRLTYDSDPFIVGNAFLSLSYSAKPGPLASKLDSSDNDERCAAALALSRLADSPEHGTVARGILRQTVRNRSSSSRSRYTAMYALSMEDQNVTEVGQNPKSLGYRLSRSALRSLPIYDMTDRRVKSMNRFMQDEIARSGLSSSQETGSKELDRLNRDLEADPIGTAFDLMFDQSDGSRLDRLDKEAHETLDAIFNK